MIGAAGPPKRQIAFGNSWSREPVALHAYLRHPVVSPAAIARMDSMLGVLSAAGFGERDARRAYGAIHTYTVGFAALEAARGQAALGDEDGGGGVMQELTRLTTPAQFKVGLDLLLDGLGAASAGVMSDV